jgi:hypothetical protein
MDDMPKKPASFDPARFRMGGTTSVEPPVRKVLTAVPTGKPGKQQFVRTRVGDEWRAECGLLKLEGDERPYIVDREAAQYVALDIKHVQLRLGIDRQGNLFLWSVPLPAKDIVENSWNLSQRQIADLAEKRWVRMTSNRTIGAYEAFEAGAEIPEPTWPDLTFAEILEIAFGHGHVIDDRDHPALRTLRGEL